MIYTNKTRIWWLRSISSEMCVDSSRLCTQPESISGHKSVAYYHKFIAVGCWVNSNLYFWHPQQMPLTLYILFQAKIFAAMKLSFVVCVSLSMKWAYKWKTSGSVSLIYQPTFLPTIVILCTSATYILLKQMGRWSNSILNHKSEVSKYTLLEIIHC